MQTRKIDGTTVRFNMPTTDGERGRLLFDGMRFDIVQGKGFTLGSVTLAAGPALIFRQHSKQMWRSVDDIMLGAESRDPIALLVRAIRADLQWEAENL